MWTSLEAKLTSLLTQGKPFKKEMYIRQEATVSSNGLCTNLTDKSLVQKKANTAARKQNGTLYIIMLLLPH